MIVLGAVDDAEATTFDGLRSRAARGDRSERDVNQNASASLAVRILDGDNERPFGCEMDDAILNKIATAESETADLDFKSAFDPESTRDWCELVKDIVAVSNSGGGCIVFGVNDDGSPAGTDLTQVRKVDPATVVDKVQKYTDQHFAGFRFGSASRQDVDVVVMVISGVSMPMVFTVTGNYDVAGKQRNAFQQGMVLAHRAPRPRHLASRSGSQR
jgi:hypothetical protein